MINLNSNALPDLNAVSTHPDGGYNFACITPDENEVVTSALLEANRYPANQRGIALSFFSENITHKPRYIINQIIIEYAKLTDGSLDKAAAFIAYSRKSSSYRAKAISIFEQLDTEITFPEAVSGYPMYSWSRLYLIAAELCEKEYQFEKALKAIEKSRERGWNNTVCTGRYAEILAKIDMSQAVEYLQNKIETDPALAVLSETLNELQTKAAKGYKFKPRRKAPEDNSEMEQQLRQLAYRYLKKA